MMDPAHTPDGLEPQRGGRPVTRVPLYVALGLATLMAGAIGYTYHDRLERQRTEAGREARAPEPAEPPPPLRGAPRCQRHSRPPPARSGGPPARAGAAASGRADRRGRDPGAEPGYGRGAAPGLGAPRRGAGAGRGGAPPGAGRGAVGGDHGASGEEWGRVLGAGGAGR